jgi:hypothetical protein
MGPKSILSPFLAQFIYYRFANQRLDLWRNNLEIVGVPEISFAHKFLLIATKSSGQKKYFSSLNDYNNNVKPSDLISGVDYTESNEDANSDGLKDLLNV